MIGKTLSHFRIVSKIGEGGMGVVYRAEDEKLRRPVALKVLPPELVGDEERRLRFLREARAAAAVTHPNIATIYEVGEDGGVVFIAMQLVEGKTLRSLIGGRPLSMKETVRLGIEIAEGLAEAHRARVIHRDLKPENVMVGADGHARILDFGLAKIREERQAGAGMPASRMETISGEMTREGKIFGTAAYMSPEQARGEAVDARSDLFSFGVVLYEIATGGVPFRGRTTTDTLSAILREQPEPPSRLNPEVPGDLERIIGKALEKEREERYQHADEIGVDLKRLKRTTESAPVQALGVPGPGAARRPRTGLFIGARWRRVLWGGAAAALLVVGAGIVRWRSAAEARVFRPGDRVVVADFENATGRPDLAAAIREAFEERLAQSALLDVVRGERLTDLLKERGHSRVTELGLGLVRRICSQGGCAAYLTGRVASEGVALVKIETDLYRVGRSRPLLSRAATAPEEGEVLNAIHNLTLEVRRAVGEAPQVVAATRPPTTRSLAAYRAFTAGTRAGVYWRHDEMVALYKRALEIDPGFVDAYLHLAGIYWSLGDLRKSREAIQKAVERAAGMPEQTRLWVEITHLDALYDYDREIERLRAYLSLYPFDRRALNYLGLVTETLGDYTSSERAFREIYRLSPTLSNLGNLAGTLANQGKVEEMERLLADFGARGGQGAGLANLRFDILQLRGDYRGILEALDRPETGVTLDEEQVTSWRATALLMAGRLGEAEEALSTLRREAEAERHLEIMSWAGLQQAWIKVRRSGRPASLAPDQIPSVRESLIELSSWAIDLVDLGAVEGLRSALEVHERAERGSRSRFVQDELRFVRACLTLLEGQPEKAHEILEPLARNSNLEARRWALARAYEAAERWNEAAEAYREILKDPAVKWWFAPQSILNQVRLARVYERLGDTARARDWYERFLTDWKDADPGILEVVEAKQRLAALGEVGA